MKRISNTLWMAALLCGLSAAVPAIASGGSAGGGGSATGGGKPGGGGSGTVGTVTPTLTTVAFVGPYYSVSGATGTVTFGYTADNSYKSIDINIANANYPDGARLRLNVYMTRPSPTAYYGTVTSVSSGTITVVGGVAKLYICTAKGDIVPDFPVPGAGTTTLYVLSPTGSTILSANLAAGGKHNGGGA